ncbi:MAG: hypothetical protein AB1486_28015, partial [Planctomycetota bacterium]
RSRSCRAPFDCTRAHELLRWRPVSSRQLFVELGIACHVLPRALESEEGDNPGRDAVRGRAAAAASLPESR